MRNLWMVLACGVVAATAHAAPVLCGPPPSAVVAVVGGGISAYSVSCGGLIFDQFQVVDAGGVPAGHPMSLVAATFDPATYNVNLYFNPALHTDIANDLLLQDIWFRFRVSGGINAIDQTNNGTPGTSISERACSVAMPADGTCAPQNRLAEIVSNGNSLNTIQPFDPANYVSPVYIWKDIQVSPFQASRDGGLNDGHLTSFAQSFHTVPEPFTLPLIGSGLLAFGLARRKAVK